MLNEIHEYLFKISTVFGVVLSPLSILPVNLNESRSLKKI